MYPHQDSSPRSRGPARSAGFTLIEVLIALALLTTALVPAFVLATNAVGLSTTIKNSLISAGLAQEGVEIVRAMRDSNWFASPAVPFDTGLDACLVSCRVQWNSTVPLPAAGDPPLKLDATTGLYSYDASGTDSIFTRRIIVTKISAYEVDVTSEVTWKERSVNKKVTVEYHLFDWIK